MDAAFFRRGLPLHQPALPLLRAVQRFPSCLSGVPAELPSPGALGASSPSGLTTFTSGAEPVHRAGGDCPQCRRQLVRKVPGATAGHAGPTCVAAPCHRAGVVAYRAATSWAKRGQQRQPAFTLSRGVQRHAIVPDVVSFRAAVSGCVKAWQSRQALPLLRALQRHAIVPDVVICGAAFSVCESSSGTSRHYFS